MSAGAGEPAAGDEEAPGPTVASRGPELAVAAFLMALAGLVITDSLRVGTGWAEDGPRSGYFPFYIGCALLLASGSVFIGQLLRWRRDAGVFAERAQIGLVVSVLVPMLVYVGLIFALGIYVSSAVLIAYFMLRYGKYKLVLTVPVSMGVPLAFFLVFEKWFLVPLPKGPLERLIGL
jgi:hypothetical protein